TFGHLDALFVDATSPPEHHPLPLHDALPISTSRSAAHRPAGSGDGSARRTWAARGPALRHTPRRRSAAPTATGPHRGARSARRRSEEHTSELQSRFDLVCRLLLEKKKTRARL